MSDYQHQFPATKWSTAPAGASTLTFQIAKIREEVEEAATTAVIWESSYHDTAVELMDCIVAAETALRMLESAGVDLDAAKEAVLAKNEARSYWRAHPFDSIEASS